MKITGGSFGVNGKVYVGEDDRLYVKSSVERSFDKADVASVEAGMNKETQFSIFSVLVGVPLFVLIGWFVFSAIGALVGLILAIAGSFYKKKTITADVQFKTSEKLQVEGWHYDIQKLVRFAAK